MNNLTGDNKIEFEKWYINDYKNKLPFIKNKNIGLFYAIPFEMQSGVITAYYDSVTLLIRINVVSTDKDCYYSIWYKCKTYYQDGRGTRNEALEQAFKEANKIRNKQLKKINP